MTDIDEAFLAERERIREPWKWVPDPKAMFVLLMGPPSDKAILVDAFRHQPALIAEIRRLRLLVMEAFDAASLAASTHIDYDPDAAHQAVREARAAVVAKLEARKLHPEFERLEQKFDPRGPTPPWFVGGGA